MTIQHFPPPQGIKAPPLSFATRTGDLLFISGIPGFDEQRALPDTFDAQFGKRPIWALISPGNDPSMKLASKLGFVRQADGTYREKPQTIWLRPA